MQLLYMVSYSPRVAIACLLELPLLAQALHHMRKRKAFHIVVVSCVARVRTWEVDLLAFRFGSCLLVTLQKAEEPSNVVFTLRLATYFVFLLICRKWFDFTK